MDALTTLVGMITCRPLTSEENEKMITAIVSVRELIVFAQEEMERREQKIQDDLMTPPWNR